LTRMVIAVIPTDNMSDWERAERNDFYHLLPRYRHGRISSEIFARDRVRSIPVDFEIAEERAGDADALAVEADKPKKKAVKKEKSIKDTTAAKKARARKKPA